MDETILSPPACEVEISGYVTATARDSKVLHDRNGRAFIERIMPGVFRRAIERDADGKIFLDLDHDGTPRAHRSDGSLTIQEDNIGLRAAAKVSDSETAALYNEGRLRGWSFTFRNPHYRTYTDDSGMEHRDAYDLDLMAVTLVSDKRTPAYTGTQIDREAPEDPIEVRFLITDDVDEVQEAGEIPMLQILKNITEILKLKGEN